VCEVFKKTKDDNLSADNMVLSADDPKFFQPKNTMISSDSRMLSAENTMISADNTLPSADNIM
jgi:hypothetical protein